MRRKLWLAALALGLVFPAAFADKLQVDLIPLGARPRNKAPIPLEARFNWNSARILEGRLEMEFYEGNRLLGRYRTSELALTGGEQRFRVLLPPSLVPFSDSQVDVHLRFVSGPKLIELDPAVLNVPTEHERSLVVGWAEAAAGSGQRASDLAQGLRLERFSPSAHNSYSATLMTSLVRLTPDELPEQPLGYTAFDVMVLTADAFKEAGERQLAALARWTRGGGSVCVFVAGGLQPAHVSFLNQLAEPTNGPVFFADDSGNLLSAKKGISCFHSGVGRAVIVARDQAADSAIDPAAWRRAATFLWKVRQGQARAIADAGHWQRPPAPEETGNLMLPAPGRNANRYRPNYVEPFSYWERPGELGSDMLNRLMPRTIRLIPFSALVGLLALFVVLIGPGDYFLLGAIRRRRLTWILFPTTSIAFTVIMVLMADHYLGLRDQRRSLILVDLDRDGTALRWNRYELVFAARDKVSVTELKDALWAPMTAQMDPQQYLQVPYPGPPRYGSYGFHGSSEGEAGPPWYDGVLPVHFQTRAALRQWRPELNRIFSFEPSPVPPPPNWSAVQDAWPNVEQMRLRLSDKAPFIGDVGRLGSGGAPMACSILAPEFLAGLCQGGADGFFFVVSQLSPNGGPDFEDAPGLDPDTGDAALVIVTQIGDDLVVYRRFYYGN